MDIQVIKSKRKTIGLEVHTDGRVILRAPMRITNRELNKFIDNHMSWIESKLSLIEKKNADKISVAPPKETISQKELDAIKEKFTTRVQYYCNIPDHLSVIGYIIICGSSAAMFFYNNRKPNREG